MYKAIKHAVYLIFHRPKMVVNFDYNKYWKSKRGSKMSHITDFQRARAEVVVRLIPEKPSIILDLGSGDGGLLSYIRGVTRHSFVASDQFELPREALADLGFSVKHIDTSKALGAQLQDKYFDVILALELFEHIPDPERLIHDISQHCSSCVLSVPNTGYFAHRLRLLFGKFPLQWRLHPGEHLRFWTYSDLEWWVRELGYQNYSIHTYEGVPLLNKIMPSVFSQGLVLQVNFK